MLGLARDAGQAISGPGLFLMSRGASEPIQGGKQSRISPTCKLSFNRASFSEGGRNVIAKRFAGPARSGRQTVAAAHNYGPEELA